MGRLVKKDYTKIKANVIIIGFSLGLLCLLYYGLTNY